MSNDFLKAYTIPLLQSNAPQPVYAETPLQPQQQTIPNETESPLICTNFNRYYAPGKQQPDQILPPTPVSRPQKRKFDSVASDVVGTKAQFFIGRDASYPEELLKLIQPLSCELCSVHMNSPKSAKDHYESKAHDKKLTAWIAHNYPENPPAIKRFFYAPFAGEGGIDALHCKLCDLKLTSLVHAKQHYSGRKHKLVAANVSNPSGAGYYDAEGKWIRTGSKHTPAVENDGRFGIGLGFKANETNEPPQISINAEISQNDIKSPTPSSLQQPTTAASINNTPDESLCCKICKISVTSAPQMKAHIEGARHRKNLARHSIDPSADIVTSTNANDLLLNTVKKLLTTTNSNDDYSMYRTPSGSYYCQSCNMSMTSVAALQQHIQGKKHIKTTSEQKSNEDKLAKVKAK